ncbi:MAG: hypothetical protein V7603_3181 [Micromonosporaceae bacterium]
MSEIAEEVLDVLRRRLLVDNSVLVRNSALYRELAREVDGVIEDVLARTELSAVGGWAVGADPDPMPVDIGASLAPLPAKGEAGRPRRGLHPVESVRAARHLFDVALPIIASRIAADNPTQMLALGLALQEAIMDRVARATRSYIEFLLETLRASRGEERRRMARELHDRVAHGMGLAVQNLELHREYAGRDSELAQAKLTAAVGALGDSLRTVQQISTELRHSAGTDGIQRALQAYLRVTVAAGVCATLDVTGDTSALPSNVNEELYLVMREATWNALRHASPTELRLAVVVSHAAVTASVSDNGCGFELATVADVRGCGLISMAERAHLLHGLLEVTSEPGKGTTVMLWVPLMGGVL